MSGISHHSTIVCGDKHTMCISTNNEVYSIGLHFKGAHGFDEGLVFPPRVIPSLWNIISIACGGDHSLCLDSKGNVFGLGSNRYGQLGLGFLDQINEPQKLPISSIKQITCGASYSICVNEEGIMFSFGDSTSGKLGHGDNERHFIPKKICTLKNIDFIDTFGTHTLVKTFDGKLFGFGYNKYGELGIGNDINQSRPVECEEYPEDVVDIKCGHNHTIILTSNNEVYSCGANYSGQLGMQIPNIYGPSPVFKKIEELTNIIRIESGVTHCLCIDIHYNLFVFGYNEEGQLGLETDTTSNCFPIKHPSLSNIIDVSKGGNHTFVKTSNNEIYAFGSNKFSQLGIKTEDDKQLTPIRVFEDNEDIWFSNINKSKAKSARSIWS